MLTMARNMWSQGEREQAELWEEKCDSIGGDAYVNFRQLQCKVGDHELRVDKKSGDAVLESDNERIGKINEIDEIRGTSRNLEVKRKQKDGEASLSLKDRFKSNTPEAQLLGDEVEGERKDFSEELKNNG